MLENAIARMLRGDPGVRLRSIAMRPDCRLDVAGLWGVMRIYRFGQMYGTARLTDIGDSLRIPFEVLEPTFDRLVTTGYVRRDGDQMWLTQPGRSRSTTSTRCSRPGSSTSWPARPTTRAGRTGAKSKPRWNASRIGFWPNVIGTTRHRRRPWPAPDASAHCTPAYHLAMSRIGNSLTTTSPAGPRNLLTSAVRSALQPTRSTPRTGCRCAPANSPGR